MIRIPTILLFILLFIIGISDGLRAEPLKRVEQLIAGGNYAEANEVLLKTIDLWEKERKTDSLAQLPWYIASIELGLSDLETATQKGFDFIESLRTANATPRQMFTALMSIMSYLDDSGQVKQSYDTTLEALDLVKVLNDRTSEEKGFVQYNLGAGAWRMGDFATARGWFSQALDNYLSYPDVSKNRLADAYNAMGAMMWLSSRLDSAEFFYNKSIKTIALMEADTVDKAFQTGIAKANVALLLQAMGRTSNAIETLEGALANYRFVLANSKNESQKTRSVRFTWRSMSNLAAFYNDIGNYRAANELVRYVYSSQKEELQPGDPELFKTLIKFGESQMSLRDYRQANATLRQALALIEDSEGDQLYWKAIALSNLAQTEDELGRITQAAKFFNQSNQIFRQALNQRYDRHYLFALSKMALFYARTGMRAKAEETAQYALQYVEQHFGETSAQSIKHITNLAEIHFALDDYNKSQQYATKSLQVIEALLAQSPGFAESLQLERQKPTTILLSVKNTWYLSTERDSEFLLSLLKQLAEALEPLEIRRNFFPQSENLNSLMEENRELYEWMKKINLELFNLTGEKKYLHALMDYHESTMFHAIRLRFFLRNNNRFFRVPLSVLEKEQRLMNDFSNLTNQNEDFADMPGFSQMLANWQYFLNELSVNHPEYYQMRYGKTQNTVQFAQSQLQPNTTIVRYLFIGDDLFGLVIGKKSVSLVPLQGNEAGLLISRLNTFLPESVEIDLLKKLYDILWLPLADMITTHHVIIVPDRELFNLSFETLVQENILTYAQMRHHSLLAKHAFSYNFSLLLTGASKQNPFKQNFIAFAPGFTDELKRQYSSRVYPAGEFDEDYLRLLPQPFTLDVVKSIRRMFGGRVFAGSRSTRENFVAHAPGHNVIHIGTHAEIDNLSPVFSRLVFAKTLGEVYASNENYFHTIDIYNYDFSSLLTVLTACETGKPAFSPGEGLISLAHAFHYAGSQSMLTGLWQIDEQASAIIVENFYGYLRTGEDKAEALRLAKLDYLSTARGRTLAPIYWAGIIVMGDPSPIFFTSKLSWFHFFLIMAAFIGLLLLIYRFRKSRAEKPD